MVLRKLQAVSVEEWRGGACGVVGFWIYFRQYVNLRRVSLRQNIIGFFNRTSSNTYTMLYLCYHNTPTVHTVFLMNHHNLKLYNIHACK